MSQELIEESLEGLIEIAESMVNRRKLTYDREFVFGPDGDELLYRLDVDGILRFGKDDRQHASQLASGHCGFLRELLGSPERWFSYRELASAADSAAGNHSQAVQDIIKYLKRKFSNVWATAFEVDGAVRFAWHVQPNQVGQSDLSKSTYRFQLEKIEKPIGRDSQALRLSELWLSRDGNARHLFIGGAANIGKSTLAQHILRLESVAPEFQEKQKVPPSDRRFEIRCDVLQSPDHLLEEIARQWFDQRRKATPDLQSDILRWLSATRTAILIDNFETFLWHRDPSVVEASEHFLKQIGNQKSIWLIVGLQGIRPPDGFSDALFEVPGKLTMDDCWRIFDRNATGTLLKSQAPDRYFRKLTRETAFNPYAMKLLARAAAEIDSFSALYDQWREQRNDLLRIGPQKYGLRIKGIKVAYAFAVGSLDRDIEAQTSLIMLAHLPGGVSRDDRTILLERSPDTSQTDETQGAVCRTLFERALAYQDRAANRIVLLDPLRFFIVDDVANNLRTEVKVLFDLKLDQAVDHYSRLALNAARLGGANDREITAALSPELTNVTWAVERLLNRALFDSGHSAIPKVPESRVALSAAYGLSRYCNWTARGRRKVDTILSGVLKRLGDAHPWKQELWVILGESKRMQLEAENSDRCFRRAMGREPVQLEPALRLICNVGFAENQKLRYRFDDAIEKLNECLHIAEGPLTHPVIDVARLGVGCYWRMAEVWRATYQFGRAEKDYETCRRKYKERVDQQGQASCLVGTAEIRRFHHEYDKAVTLYHAARRLYARTHGSNYVANCIQGAAEARLAMRRRTDLVSIADEFVEAKRFYEELADSDREIAWCNWGIGECYRLRRRYVEALQQFDLVMKGSAHRKGIDHLLWCHWSLREIAISQKNKSVQTKHTKAITQLIDIKNASQKAAWDFRRLGDLAMQHNQRSKAEFLWIAALHTFARLGNAREASVVEAILTQHRMSLKLARTS